MGNKSSRERDYRHSSSFPTYSQQTPWDHAPPPAPRAYAEPPSTAHYYPEEPKRRLQKMYSRIADNYTSLEQVTEALAKAGLESSNLIVGIDFTKSNEWTGARSFNRRSLHHIGDTSNPYEQAISIIGRTLSAFDEDNLIPCFGFGDARTHDENVFSFFPDERPCNGFEEVLARYREIVPQLRLAGPTSFAPIIESAITVVEQSGGQYHVLLIIADGQSFVMYLNPLEACVTYHLIGYPSMVTRSVDTENGHLSPQEQSTIEAIVKASEYPLSIILVGVGDGPWDMMRQFDDNIPYRAFDNFQFVNFTEIMSKNVPQSRKEAEFALAALMEIPSQYNATIDLKILGRRRGKAPDRVSLPPPAGSYSAPSYASKTSRASTFQHSPLPHYESNSPSQYGYDTGASYPHSTNMSTAPASSSYDNQVCPICLTNAKDCAFGCGHQTCYECGQDLQTCPICRSPIQTRIKLY